FGVLYKTPDLVPHHRTDVADGLDIVQRGVEERLDAAETPRQGEGGGFAHHPDAERVDEAAQRSLFRGFERSEQVVDRLLAHPLEREPLLAGERIEVGGRLD